MLRNPTLKTPGSLLIWKGIDPHRLPPAVSLVRDFLIIFPTANIVVVWISFLFGVPITAAHLLVSFFFCAAAAFLWQGQKSVRTSLVAFLLLFLLFISAIFLSISLIDIYGDYRSYHGPAVIALSDGWNPLYEWNVCEWDDTNCMRTSKFIDHYPKAQWYISAEFYSLFNNLDTGKCMNLLMLALCFIVAYEVVRSLLPDQPYVSLVISAVIAANPVTIAQLFSGTVDGLLSSVLSIFILLQIRYIFSNEKKYLYLSIVISVYLINIKFTGLIYAVTFSTLLVLIIFLMRKKFPFISRSFLLLAFQYPP